MNFRRSHLYLLGAFAVAAFVGAAFVWNHRDSLDREHLAAAMESLAGMGPWLFFSLMAVLPLFWVPVSPFLLVAPAFGMATAVFGSLAALTVNMVLAWFVSGKWFRPFFLRLVARFGYSIPEVSGRSMVGVAILIRITPGLPFPLQNYLLGLARMALGPYLLVSLPINWGICASFLILGKSIMAGNLQLAFAGVALAVAVALALRYWRARLQAKAFLENAP